MTKAEKILVQLFFVFAIITTLFSKDAELSVLRLGPPILMSASFVALGLIYIYKTGFSFYSVVFLLFILYMVGGLSKVVQVTGANELLILSYLRLPLIGILLIRTALVYRGKGLALHYNWIIGSLTIFQFIGIYFAISMISDMSVWIDEYMPFIVVLTIAAMRIYKVSIRVEEDRMLMLMLLSAALDIIISISLLIT